MELLERRLSRCLDDCIRRVSKDTGISVEVSKYAHNEDAPEYELKYELHFNSCDDANTFSDTFNSLPVIYTNQVGIDVLPLDEETAVLFVNWDGSDSSVVDVEDDFVKRYCTDYAYEVQGSYEEDLKILSGDWCWGFIGSFSA